MPACRYWCDLQGHRAARGLAPENTLAAFERALEIGVSTLELDVAITTADSVAVVSHDPALFRAIARDAQGGWLRRARPADPVADAGAGQAYDVGRLNPAHAYRRPFPEQAPRDGQRIPTLASDLYANEGARRRGRAVQHRNQGLANRPDDTVTARPLSRCC
ncbi:MAG: hypothetical protein IPF39_16030 [Comamonadaceae bacterium]|uniref:glycerophosphodiester phosphodiesterase family protein n=1 Tax=Candidatus Skiveiella danica TaxID=3386177 RepID=UPI00390B91CA|nr:hypothetical protein [Comamonadaceae bacterium]